MEDIRSFRELKVWLKAMDAAMRVFELSKRWPTEERYSLMDQVRRSSRSVPANISEDLALYSSFTVRQDRPVLWYTERTFFLLGRVIGREWFEPRTTDPARD